jgi:hypothetical protein
VIVVIALLVIGATVVTCFRAYHSVRLLEQDPEAWARLQHRSRKKNATAGSKSWAR